ncbi:hypothetical protein [Herpetosiphon llansteffanensis]|uniref:hypothetical protein n=1 Tax=Herpetosiphon llansteffanensis TaxID=2094568 RepID=UPI000D7C240D|nr:hypothetical protein [Herpetosiphon llansteffanensis]
MQIEYPTLRVNQQRLLDTAQRMYKQAQANSEINGLSQPDFARCLYYLRKPQAADYLRQVAQKRPNLLNYEAARINWYRLAGDQAAMQTVYQQLLHKAAKADRRAYADYQVQIFQAHFWLANDRECIQLYQREASLQEWPLFGLIAQIAEARLTRNQQRALAMAQRFAQEIRTELLEPWDDWILNYWDLYEICCGLLDPPLQLDTALLAPASNPSQRLLELCRAEQVVAVEWATYNNQDEGEIGYQSYTLADGTTKSFGEGFVNQELERLVWDIMNFDWFQALSQYQQYGIYRLDVAKAVVNHVGEIWTSYDYDEMEAQGWLDENYALTPHPTDPDLYVMSLPEAQHQTIDVTFWQGERRNY